MHKLMGWTAYRWSLMLSGHTLHVHGAFASRASTAILYGGTALWKRTREYHGSDLAYVGRVRRVPAV